MERQVIQYGQHVTHKRDEGGIYLGISPVNDQMALIWTPDGILFWDRSNFDLTACPTEEQSKDVVNFAINNNLGPPTYRLRLGKYHWVCVNTCHDKPVEVIQYHDDKGFLKSEWNTTAHMKDATLLSVEAFDFLDVKYMCDKLGLLYNDRLYWQLVQAPKVISHVEGWPNLLPKKMVVNG